MNKILFLATITAVILVTFLFLNFAPQHFSAVNMTYTEFMQELEAGKVTQVTIAGQIITGTLQNNKRFTTSVPSNAPNLWQVLQQKKVNIAVKPSENDFWRQILVSWLPLLFLPILFVLILITFIKNKRN